MDSGETKDESARNGFQANSDSQSAIDRSSTSCNPIEIHFDEIEAFEWNDEFEKILSCLARTGLPPPSSPPWSMILKAMLYRLKITVQNYFKLGTSSLFDTREEPAGGWLWTSEDLQRSIDRVYLAFKYFSDHTPEDGINSHAIEHYDQIHSIRSAPFTIQRLTELMFPQSTSSGIHPHYTTLPKYLRAIQRVLSVSSPVISYAVNTFTSHPNDSITSISAPSSRQSHSSCVNGGQLAEIPPNNPRPRRHSTTIPITPILSPIPWLVNTERHSSLSPELASSDDRQSRHTSPFLLSSGSDERPITPPLMSSSPLPIFTTTPPQISPSHSSPNSESTIISPARISSPSPITQPEILNISTGENEPDTHQSIDSSSEAQTPLIDDTPMLNDVTSNSNHSFVSHNQLIPTQSDDTAMDEPA